MPNDSAQFIERMSTILDFLSNNALVSTLIAAGILTAVGWIWKSRRDRRDSDAIYKFMLASKGSTDFSFRTTHAIASHTKLPTGRVGVLCARHPKIRRNEKEKESWIL